MYTLIVDELRELWRMEVQASLTGWHFAGVMSGEEVERPKIPDFSLVRRAFDRWLISEPEPGDDDEPLAPEHLDTMIAFGWREVEDDDDD